MEYRKFESILNEIIFYASKKTLLEKIAKSPNRYIGLFRPTKPKAKLLQNLLQSHEIRFGDAFEKLLEKYLQEFGFKILNNRLSTKDGDRLNVDQFFSKQKQLFFIEQKVRDDHDSTKKRGQIDNFEKKLGELINLEGENNLTGIFYFIDPTFIKNKNYYIEALQRLNKDYDVRVYLFYGKELFAFFKKEEIWAEIIAHLKRWKKSIPDIPEINFDLSAKESFEDIKNLSPQYFRKLFSNKEIFDEILSTIFPEMKTLDLY